MSENPTDAPISHPVLLLLVLGLSAEECEGERALDVVVAVDGGGDGGDDPLADALVLAQRVDGLDVLVGEVLGRVPVVLHHDVVGHNDRGEHGEALNFKGFFENSDNSCPMVPIRSWTWVELTLIFHHRT